MCFRPLDFIHDKFCHAEGEPALKAKTHVNLELCVRDGPARIRRSPVYDLDRLPSVTLWTSTQTNGILETVAYRSSSYCWTHLFINSKTIIKVTIYGNIPRHRIVLFLWVWIEHIIDCCLKDFWPLVCLNFICIYFNNKLNNVLSFVEMLLTIAVELCL